MNTKKLRQPNIDELPHYNLIDMYASELLNLLSNMIPDIEDGGEIGERVLKRSLEAYQEQIYAEEEE